MTSIYHIHRPQTNQWHHIEEMAAQQQKQKVKQTDSHIAASSQDIELRLKVPVSNISVVLVLLPERGRENRRMG